MSGGAASLLPFARTPFAHHAIAVPAEWLPVTTCLIPHVHSQLGYGIMAGRAAVLGHNQVRPDQLSFHSPWCISPLPDTVFSAASLCSALALADGLYAPVCFVLSFPDCPRFFYVHRSGRGEYMHTIRFLWYL